MCDECGFEHEEPENEKMTLKTEGEPIIFKSKAE